MFMLKKKPKVQRPEVKPGEDFSLFVKGAKAPSAGPSEGGASRFGRTAHQDLDVIDVEVVERVDDAAVHPGAADTVEPAQSASAPPFAEQPAAAAATRAEDAPATASEAPSEVVGFAGLRARKVRSAEPVSPQQVQEPESAGATQGFAARFKKVRPSEADTSSAASSLEDPVVPASEKAGGLKSLWRKKPAQGTPLSEDAEAVGESPAASGPPEADASSADLADTPPKAFFARKNKDKPAKATKKKDAPKPRVSARAAANELDFFVELDEGRRVYWRLGPTRLAQVDASGVSVAASFGRGDHRILAESALKYSQANDIMLAEVGEEVRIVNATREVGAIYGSTVARLEEIGLSAGPGLYLVELLRSAQGRPEGDVITGVLLRDDDTGLSLAVLYHIDRNGEVSPPQVTVNPDNLDFTLSQFASSRRFGVENAQVQLFGNAQLLSVAKQLQVYPREAVWNGISVRKLLWTAAMVACGAAGLTGTWAATQYAMSHSAVSQAASLKTQVKRAEAELKELIGQSATSFAQNQSLNLKEVTDRAASLWVPHSRVVVEATVQRQTYEVSMPLVRAGLVNNRPSVLGQMMPQDVEPLINMPAPEGCTKETPGLSGGLNAVQISVVCESAPGPGARYRLD